MDGVGKLLDPDDHAWPSKRLGSFLDNMGVEYRDHRGDLLALRHSLVHTAINVEAFLWHTSIGSDQHLKQTGIGGFIYVDTKAMYDDVKDAFERFRVEVREYTVLMKRAANRLRWIEESPKTNPYSPTPPPPVAFIFSS